MGRFQNKMAQVLHDRGMTLVELSKRTGKNRVTLANMRDGTPTVRFDTVEDVCNALGCKPCDLFPWLED